MRGSSLNSNILPHCASYKKRLASRIVVNHQALGDALQWIPGNSVYPVLNKFITCAHSTTYQLKFLQAVSLVVQGRIVG